MPSEFGGGASSPRLQHHELWTDVQRRRVRGGHLDRQLPVSARAARVVSGAEHLPQRRRVGQVDDLGRVGSHPIPGSSGGTPMLTPDPRWAPVPGRGCRGVDDLRPAVAICRPRLSPRSDLDASHRRPGSQHLDRVDHRVGHRFEVGNQAAVRARRCRARPDHNPPVGLRSRGGPGRCRWRRCPSRIAAPGGR